MTYRRATPRTAACPSCRRPCEECGNTDCPRCHKHGDECDFGVCVARATAAVTVEGEVRRVCARHVAALRRTYGAAVTA